MILRFSSQLYRTISAAALTRRIDISMKSTKRAQRSEYNLLGAQ
jgi:hypothetical protein